MPIWNFNSQNYKVNRKIKEEIDPNQINYKESDDDPLDVIKRMYIYITDENGNILPEVTITIDEMEIITGYNGILISNFPNKEQTITVEKEGYKAGTATVIYNAETQTHEFILVPSNSESDSSSTSTGSPRFIAKTYYFKSYDDENKTTLWGTGTARTTGIVEGDYSEVKILTNSTEESFIGQKFFIESNAETDQIYELFTDAGTTSANIFVEIFETEPEQEQEPEPIYIRPSGKFNMKVTVNGNALTSGTISEVDTAGSTTSSYNLNENGEINNIFYPIVQNSITLYSNQISNAGMFSTNNSFWSGYPIMADDFAEFAFIYDTETSKYTTLKWNNNSHIPGKEDLTLPELTNINRDSLTLIYDINDDSNSADCTVSLAWKINISIPGARTGSLSSVTGTLINPNTGELDTEYTYEPDSDGYIEAFVPIEYSEISITASNLDQPKTISIFAASAGI